MLNTTDKKRGVSVAVQVMSVFGRTYDATINRLKPVVCERHQFYAWAWRSTPSGTIAIRGKIKKESWCVESWG